MGVAGKFWGTSYLKVLKCFADTSKYSIFLLQLENVTLPLSYKQIITEKLIKLIIIIKMLIHLEIYNVYMAGTRQCV